MIEPDNRTVARYVLGIATREEAIRVATGRASDADLAARVNVLREVAGLETGESTADEEDVPPLRLKMRRRRPFWWRAAALVAFLWAGAGLTWAGWKLLVTPPLFADNFNSGWGDRQKWTTARRHVFIEAGHARLFDRGHLVTVPEFSRPIDLRFRWKWIDLSGDLLYRDELVVALRTSGEVQPQWPFEGADGLQVRFRTYDGRVWIYDHATQEVLAQTPVGAVPLAADEWYDVRITDDGETVSVYLGGRGRGADAMERPLLRASVKDNAPSHHIAFYNRERVASASHDSLLDDIVIRPLEKP